MAQNVYTLCFGKTFCDIFEFPESQLKATRQSDIPNLGPRPSDCSMDSMKAFRQGFRALPLKAELKSIKSEALSLVKP